MKIGYARVSTAAQNLDMQVSALFYALYYLLHPFR